MVRAEILGDLLREKAGIAGAGPIAEFFDETESENDPPLEDQEDVREVGCQEAGLDDDSGRPPAPEGGNPQ